MATSPGGVNPTAPGMRKKPLPLMSGGKGAFGPKQPPIKGNEMGAMQGAIQRRLSGGPDMGTPERPPRKNKPPFSGPGKPIAQPGGVIPKRPRYSPNV